MTSRETKILNDMGFKHIIGNEFDHPIYGYLWLPERFNAKHIVAAIFELGMKKKSDEIKVCLGIRGQ